MAGIIYQALGGGGGGPRRAHRRSKAVQVDPVKPTLKAPGTKRLKLKYDELLSNFAFPSNLRRYAAGEYLDDDERQVGRRRLTPTEQIPLSLSEMSSGVVTRQKGIASGSCNSSECPAGTESGRSGGSRYGTPPPILPIRKSDDLRMSKSLFDGHSLPVAQIDPGLKAPGLTT